jgi:uncharacterized protein (DUF4415 family)
MTPVRKVTTFRIDADLLEAMGRLQERDGIPHSEQIRRALRPWLEQKGVIKAADRRVVKTQRKA